MIENSCFGMKKRLIERERGRLMCLKWNNKKLYKTKLISVREKECRSERENVRVYVRLD